MKKKKNFKPTAGQRISNVVVLVFGLLCIAYYLAMGIFVRFNQSLLYIWPIFGVLCIGHYLFWKRAFRRRRRPPKALRRLIRIVFIVCLVFFLAVEGIILAWGMVKPVSGLDYIVVLGAKVNPGRVPSGSLANRIMVAGEYLNDNPDTKAVLSGGKGADEEISEAQCMYDNLVKAGIDPERLILEDKSTDTSENLRFSFEIIGDDSSTVGLVTNNFHIFRALALARGLRSNVFGIPVFTTWISFPHYMVREFIGVVYETVRGNLTFF